MPEGEEEDVVRVQEDRRGADEPISAEESNESGQAATRAEALVERRFGPAETGEALRRLAREAASASAEAGELPALAGAARRRRRLAPDAARRDPQ